MPIGETPNDRQQRREASERRIAGFIASDLRKTFAPLPPDEARFRMPGMPSFDEQSARVAAPPKDTRMSENGNGQYGAIRAEVEGVKGQIDNVKSQFHDLKEDINSRFSDLSQEVKAVGASISEFIRDQGNARGESWLKIGGMVLGIVTVTLTIFGYVATLQKQIQDITIQFTNDRITTQGKAIDGGFASMNSAITDLTGTVRGLANTTIPRAELEVRLNSNRDATMSLSKTVAENVVPRTEFERRIEAIMMDVKTLKDETLKREDLDGRLSDFTKRLDLISNRVEALQANSAGSAVLQEQVRQIAAQIVEIRTKLLVIPHVSP